MILLTSTSDILRLITSAASAVDVHASFMDFNGTIVVPGRQNTVGISGATTTTIVSAPGASIQRNIKMLTVRNRGALNQDVTIVHFDGSLAPEMHKVTLAPGESLQYSDALGFVVL